MLGELIPEGWVGKYVLLELGINEPVRLTARLDGVADGGILALAKISVPSPEARRRWSTPSHVTKFGARYYPWHSVRSVRLLEPEEKPPLEEEGWPPEEGAAAR